MFTGEHLVLLDGDDHGSVLWVTASMLDIRIKHATQRQQLCNVISQMVSVWIVKKSLLPDSDPNKCRAVLKSTCTFVQQTTG